MRRPAPERRPELKRRSTCAGPLPSGTTAAGGQRRHRKDLRRRRAGGPGTSRRATSPWPSCSWSPSVGRRVGRCASGYAAGWSGPRGRSATRGARRRGPIGCCAPGRRARRRGRPAPGPARARRWPTFDAATIATTHQFCQQVLRGLGVAGDPDPGAELVEDLRADRRERRRPLPGGLRRRAGRRRSPRRGPRARAGGRRRSAGRARARRRSRTHRGRDRAVRPAVRPGVEQRKRCARPGHYDDLLAARDTLDGSRLRRPRSGCGSVSGSSWSTSSRTPTPCSGRSSTGLPRPRARWC